MALERLAIVGTGLIGASVGLAAKRAGVGHVAGYDADPEFLAAAAERGAVDEPVESLVAAVEEAELVVVATPVASLEERIADALGAAAPEATVTDVGSTKSALCAAIGDRVRFIGGHPVCGSEARGPASGSDQLFQGATWFLTPVAETEPERYRLLHGFVASLGAVPVAIDPTAHDRLLALTSHLPHALANVVLNHAGSVRVDGHEPLAAAGGSLRDMTRVAGANPRIWIDIFLDNAEELQVSLAELLDASRSSRRRSRRGTPAGSPAGWARPGETAAACWPGPTRIPARCSASGCTSPTGRECCPVSPRRSEPSRSTSRTSSSTTCRPSAAEP
jgi:prephenate dehydrogenase